MKEALLTITTQQDEHDEPVSFTTRTKCEETEQGIKFDYEENLSEEDDAVSTSLLISNDSILVERKGESGGDMFFKDAATYETKYRAYGGLSLGMQIFTTSLDIKKDDFGIRATVDYQLFLEGTSVGRVGMDIKAEFL